LLVNLVLLAAIACLAAAAVNTEVLLPGGEDFAGKISTLDLETATIDHILALLVSRCSA
jgi:hypothetical protein